MPRIRDIRWPVYASQFKRGYKVPRSLMMGVDTRFDWACKTTVKEGCLP